MIWDAITWIWNLIQGGFKWTVEKLLAGMSELLHWLVTWVQDMFAWFKTAGWVVAHAVLDGVHQFFPSVDLAPFTSSLDVINNYFPLAETITMALLLFALWVLVFLYRLFKSWVPTLAN